VQRGNGSAHHRRLAGAGRADDQDERVVAGDDRGGLVLDYVELAAFDGGRRLRVGRRRLGGPVEDLLLLSEHRFAGDVRGDRFDPDRPAVRRPPPGVLG